jgi:hypothetical protein
MKEHSARRHATSRPQPVQAALMIGALAAGIFLGVIGVHAYDPRLDEALAALQKAAALVEASSAGDVSARTQHKFDSERGKAIASIQDAMDHIVAAGLSADSDGGAQ